MDGTDVVAAVLVWATFTLIGGWAFMLLVGVVHHEWLPQCPTVGFGWSIVIAFLLRVTLLTFTNKKND